MNLRNMRVSKPDRAKELQIYLKHQREDLEVILNWGGQKIYPIPFENESYNMAKWLNLSIIRIESILDREISFNEFTIFFANMKNVAKTKVKTNDIYSETLVYIETWKLEELKEYDEAKPYINLVKELHEKEKKHTQDMDSIVKNFIKQEKLSTVEDNLSKVENI